MIEFRQQKRAASKTAAQYARVAQMDSAAASEAAGHGFKSRPMHRQSHHSKRAAAFLFTPPAAKKSRCRNQKPQWNGSPYDNTARSHITLPDTAANLLTQYDEACEELEAVTERKQKAENLLKEMIGENEVGTAGDRVITWKSVSQERLDSKTLRAEHPVLYKKYVNQTSYRRFSVKAVV